MSDIVPPPARTLPPGRQRVIRDHLVREMAARDRRHRKRRWPFFLALPAALLAAGGALAYVANILPLSIADQPPPQTDMDRLPEAVLQRNLEAGGAAQGGDARTPQPVRPRFLPSTSRLVFEQGGIQAWFVGAEGGLICQVLNTPDAGRPVYGTSCASRETLSTLRLGTQQVLEGEPIVVSSLVPDGYDAVRLTLRDDEGVTTKFVTIQMNVIVTLIGPNQRVTGAELLKDGRVS